MVVTDLCLGALFCLYKGLVCLLGGVEVEGDLEDDEEEEEEGGEADELEDVGS